jgi:hypothetical protein
VIGRSLVRGAKRLAGPAGAATKPGLIIAVWLACSPPAFAQAYGDPGPRRGSWEVGGGAVFVGGYDLGERSADLTRNTGGPAGPFQLFDSDTRVTGVPGLQARLGFYVTDNLSIEGGFRFARPVLEIRLSDDAEEARDQTAEETLSQYVVDAAAVWHFGRGRSVPFLIAGGGYVRELHEGDELVETGTMFHAGAGFKYWFGATGRVGLRAEGGVSFRDGGFDFDDGIRIVPTAGASIVVAF